MPDNECIALLPQVFNTDKAIMQIAFLYHRAGCKSQGGLNISTVVSEIFR